MMIVAPERLRIEYSLPSAEATIVSRSFQVKTTGLAAFIPTFSAVLKADWQA